MASQQSVRHNVQQTIQPSMPAATEVVPGIQQPVRHALLFDLDGTLLESMTLWYTLAERYLNRRGVPDVPAGLHRILAGMSMQESAEWLKTRFELQESPEAIQAGVEQLLVEGYRDWIEPKPGTMTFMQALADTGRYRMALVTATPRPLVEPVLRRTGLERFFEFILTVPEVGIGKHQPDIYLQAASRLDATPETAIVFEDALYAIRTARNARFPVVGIADVEAETDREDIKAKVDCFVERIGDALPWVMENT